MKKLVPVVFIAIFLFASCEEEATSKPSKIDFTGISDAIKPGDNFFMHVNKVWYDTIQIADDQVGVGSYSFLNIPQKLLLQNILEDVSSVEHPKGSIEQKVGDFYTSGMDTAQINKRGFEPIQPIIQRIDAITNIKELLYFVAKEIETDNTSIVNLNIYADDKNSSMNIMHASQAGLGLPDRDYYFKTDSTTIGIQNAYQKYITTLFQLTNQIHPEKMAEMVYEIEKKLAESHKTRIERRDIQANYNKFSVADMTNNEPNLDWVTLFKNLNVVVDSVDVEQPAYYSTLNKLLGTISLSDWKTYLKAHTIDTYANVLSSPFEMAVFEYNKVLNGQSEQKPRAQLMVQQVDRQLGFALGQLYVKKYFNEAAKNRVLELVNNLQKSFENRISKLDWMSDSTKVKAKEKLYAITKKIGYPDVWRSYDVIMDKEKYFENVVALQKNDYEYNLKELNKAPNKDRWGTTPGTVTAYYNPSLNEIVFPAGILQFPYFDVEADDAVNYGGIGMVIGHELTHAFDDNGAQYDKDGNVKNWWTDGDLEKFKAKTQQLIDRYNTFTVLDTVPVKGALTIGENTADNGGISIAYDAFKMTEQGQDTIKINGYTPDQRFFLSIARIWRVKTRDEFLRNYVNTNPHSPAIWRVNGPLMNITPFYEAFNVQPSDKNYKAEDERIKIW
tara:strand:+ start:5661 stop:7673 length:2013 start_codon:yes stop_codon:yes gene_type:complete